MAMSCFLFVNLLIFISRIVLLPGWQAEKSVMDQMHACAMD